MLKELVVVSRARAECMDPSIHPSIAQAHLPGGRQVLRHDRHSGSFLMIRDQGETGDIAYL